MQYHLFRNTHKYCGYLFSQLADKTNCEIQNLNKQNLLHRDTKKKNMTTKKNIKVAIICPYPFDSAPGQRFRYEQYLSFLAQNGVVCDIYPFIDSKVNTILYRKGHFLQKITGLLKATLKRISLLGKLRDYDYVWVYREASLIGPPWFEWIVAKVLHKKMLLDFDDAIWIPQTVSRNPLVAFIRWHKKTENLCRWAYRISCGNDFLCAYARQFNPNVVKLPTTIDTHNRHNRLKLHRTFIVNDDVNGTEVKDNNIGSHEAAAYPHNNNKGVAGSIVPKTVIGWTGTITTMDYLHPIYPIIARLAEKYPLELRIISNSPPPTDRWPFVRYVPWQKETEIEDLLAFDIGIMPLATNDWERGKCGFKALQYMALGIPAVVSPVGVNTEIICDSQNGLLAANDEAWFAALERLIVLPTLRKRFGDEGRKTVEKYFSVQSQQEAYLALFRS